MKQHTFRRIILGLSAGALLNSGLLAFAIDESSGRPAQSLKFDKTDTAISEAAGADRGTAHGLNQNPQFGQLFRASELMGMKVEGAGHEKLGEIKDLMLDLRTGQAPMAILSSGGFFGVGDKLMAIPLTSLSRLGEAKTFTLNTEMETLKNGPAFDRNHWPSSTDQAWGADVFRHYGANPYWTTGTAKEGHALRTGSVVSEPSGALLATTTKPATSIYQESIPVDTDTQSDRVLRLYQRGKGAAEQVDRAVKEGNSDSLRTTGVLTSTGNISSEAAGGDRPGAARVSGQGASARAGAMENDVNLGEGQFIRASQLVGYEVKDSGNQRVGEIKDLAIDMPSGRIAYAVIGSGGILGVGERMFAVPSNLLTSPGDSKSLVLKVDREKLGSAPAFSKGNWDKETRQAYVSEVYSFYGIQPYFGTSGNVIHDPSGSELKPAPSQSGSELKDPAGAGKPAEATPQGRANDARLPKSDGAKVGGQLQEAQTPDPAGLPVTAKESKPLSEEQKDTPLLKDSSRSEKSANPAEEKKQKGEEPIEKKSNESPKN